MKGIKFTDMDIEKLIVIQSVIDKKEQIKKPVINYIYPKDRYGN